MFQSSFAKQFVEANVLLFIKSKRVLMTRRWGLLSGLVGQFSVGIHNIGKKKGRDLGATPASQSERFCRTNHSLSDKNTARSHLAMGKIRRRKSGTTISTNAWRKS